VPTGPQDFAPPEAPLAPAGEPIHVLLVEDDDRDAWLFTSQVQEEVGGEVRIERVDRLAHALQRLTARSTDVVVLDLTLPDSRGADTFLRLHAGAAGVPIIVLSGMDDETVALQAVRAGAQDYLIKGEVDGARLVRAIRYATERHRHQAGLEDEVRQSTARLEATTQQLQAHTLALQREMEGRQAAQQALQRSEEHLQLSQRLEAVWRLAAGVTRDFDNLLTVVLGAAELLRPRLRNSPSALEDLAAIDAAARRGAKLTRQLVAFGRRQVLARHPVDLNGVLRDLEDILSRALGDEVDLVLRLEPELLAVQGDEGELERVFINLAVNARDAMPSGGALSVYTGNVRMDSKGALSLARGEEATHVCVRVADTGVGMDEETRRRIFDPFFTTKGPEQGSGLGLSTAYGVIRQSGGSIWVDSKLGKGTAFTICLPRTDAVPEPRPRRTAAAPERLTGVETVLLVEPDGVIRDVARRLLFRYGYTVLEAATGEEALGFWEPFPGPVDLLITDLVLPRMRGPELAARLLKSRPEVRMLYVTGHGDDPDEAWLLEDGGPAVLEKPYSAGELVAKVREVLDA